MNKLLILFLVATVACGRKQDSPDFESVLTRNAQKARSDEQKITWLSRLAWYYVDIDRRKSDSVMNAAYSLAGTSKDNGILILTYLFDAQRHLALSDYKHEMETVRALADKAYSIASSGDYSDYLAYSYLYMAHSSRMLGDVEAANGYLSKAYNLVSNSKSDSLKIEFYYLRSQVLQDKRELNLALDDALQVRQISERSENNNLKVLAYRRLSNMYGDLDSVKAGEYYKNLIEVSKKMGNDEELIWANLLLGRFFSRQTEFATEGSRYLHNAMVLARQINHRNLIIQSHLSLVRYYLNTGQPDSTVDYLNKNIGELIRYYSGNGQAARLYYTYGTFYYDLGRYYRTNKNPDKANNSFWQALLHLWRSDSAYSNDAVVSRQSDLSFFRGATNYHLYFLNKGSANDRYWDSSFVQNVSNYYTRATDYFFRTQDLARQMKDPEFMRNVFSWMENLFRDSADYYDYLKRNNYSTTRTARLNYYKMTYLSRDLYDSCNLAFQSLSNQKEKIRIERENQARLDEIEAIRQRQKDSLKMIGITAALAVIFLLLILAGFLRVSEFWIRVLGVFAFLTLFEFIVLIIDRPLHKFTHGEVVSLLVIKVAIAAILSPIHHVLEKKVIQSLTRRKLLREDARRLKQMADTATDDSLS